MCGSRPGPSQYLVLTLSYSVEVDFLNLHIGKSGRFLWVKQGIVKEY